MTSTNVIVGEGSLGAPLTLSEENTMTFYIHNFEDLDHSNYLTTPIVCFGLPWRIQICPGGDEQAKPGFLSIFLACCLQNDDQIVKATFSSKVGNRQPVQITYRFSKANATMGWYDFMTRSDAIQALNENGSLVVKVSLRIWLPKQIVWKPKNNFQKKLSKLFNNDHGKDVKFILGNGEFVWAHSSVLSIQCPDLYEIIADAEDSSNIGIENTNADLFATLIRFMYLESLPNDFDLSVSGLELLQLANRLGYTELKMLLEAELVGSDGITVETAAEYLLLADGHSCALLKEAAMDLVIAQPKEVMKTDGWEKLKESSTLLAEVMEFQLPKGTANANRVSKLRKRLDDAGLDVDGTKEMLVKRCTEI